MVHSVSVDHSKRRIERTSNGRIKAAFAPVTEEVRSALAGRLAAAIDGEVRFDAGSRALYATDASNYRQVPLGLVVPRCVEDVIRTMELCREADVPVLSRGGGTSLAGEGCNVAVVIDFSKHLDRVLAVLPDRQLAVVEPGCILDTLRTRCEEHRLTFGPDPATHDRNTLGGMIGNNSCGVHSIMAGRTSDNVESLDILTYDGVRMTVGRTSDRELAAARAEGGRRAEIYAALEGLVDRYGKVFREQFPRIPRRVSGYENLDALLPENGFNVARALVGTEGTCVTVLSATLGLVPSPPVRALVLVGFDDVFAAADAVPEVLECEPIGLEGIDDLLVEFIRRKHLHAERADVLPTGQGWLVAEFGGDAQADAADRANRLVQCAQERGWSVKLIQDAHAQKNVWRLREAALAATAHVPDMPENWPGWEDSAVPREKLGGYLRELKALFAKHGYTVSVYGHFGDGLVHCRVPFNLRTERGVADWQRFLEEAADLVVRYGGSLSGEHGDGQARGELLKRMYGPELMQAFAEFKAIWDPSGRMNPGKVIDPFPATSNLRVGPTYQPGEVSHHYTYREDGGSFAKAMQRCVGVGACRRTGSNEGVMCPSYMVTRDEKHSTRGRARLLFEMLHGGPLVDGWRSREVEEALDLCLACKACKSDCPVNVDMATYKSEFRAHYYEGRWRPRAAYAMGRIHKWSRIAGSAPWLANAVFQTPVVSGLAKWAGDIAQSRSIPRYASRPFVSQFQQRARAGRTHSRGERVVLWPDTFNNYFRTRTAIAALEVLERLGCDVVVPEKPVCCGRPLYDWGWIEQARDLWRNTLDVLARDIRAGTPIIGLEPACVSAFRDELPNLMPSDERAVRLSGQVVLLTEYIAGKDWLPRSNGHDDRVHALVQLHCHHHAVLDTNAEARVLERLGLDAEVIPSGCCGMAGSFGFESGKHDVSIAAAERVVLPKVRAASRDSLVIANGFSCREQIEQGCGRQTVHVAEVLADRLRARDA